MTNDLTADQKADPHQPFLAGVFTLLLLGVS
jgi:hypothetical protein